MAINHNDRVSTARLQEFWQAAKTWIRGLVSDEIDASETAMSAAVDTKIQAAKPNYRMPNTDDQIGMGYGANSVEKNYVTLTISDSNITYSNFYSAFNTNTFPEHYYYVQRNCRFLHDQTASSNDLGVFGTIFSLMAGKMTVIPPIMSSVVSTFEDGIPDEYFNSTFTEYEYSNNTYYALISHPFNYEGHTYQTRLWGVNAVSPQLHVDLKTDDGEFTPITSGSVILTACFDNRNPLCNKLTGYVASNSIYERNIVNNAVTTNKIQATSVIKSKLDGPIQSTIPLHLLSDSQSITYNNKTYKNQFYLSFKKMYGFSATTYVICGFAIRALYNEILADGNKISYDAANNKFTIMANAMFGTSNITFINSWDISPATTGLFGFVVLETDTNKYWSPCYIEIEAQNNPKDAKIICTLLDGTLAQHLSEPYSYFRMYTTTLPYSALTS